jgi:hypothetical protein
MGVAEVGDTHDKILRCEHCGSEADIPDEVVILESEETTDQSALGRVTTTKRTKVVSRRDLHGDAPLPPDPGGVTVSDDVLEGLERHLEIESEVTQSMWARMARSGCLAMTVSFVMMVGGWALLNEELGRWGPRRNVANRQVEPGGWYELEPIQVDPTGNVRVTFVASIELSDEFLEKYEHAGRIRYQLPINFEVRNSAGNLIHAQADTIELEGFAPHRALLDRHPDDRIVRMTFLGTRFGPGDDADLTIRTLVPAADNHGNRVESVRVKIEDRVGRGSRTVLLIATVSIIVGAILLFFGIVQVGIYRLRKSRAVARTTADAVPKPPKPKYFRP